MLDQGLLHSDKLGFFGAITASLSHELKNVLATINEYAGLLQDQAEAAETGATLSSERMLKLSARLSKQVERGSGLIGRLNYFAHTADEPVAMVDLEQLLTELCLICDRFARLAEATLEREFSAASGARCRLDPFGLQQVVYIALRAALAAVDLERHVTLTLAPQGASWQVVVCSADPLLVQGQQLQADAVLSRLLEQTGIELEVEAQRLVLSLP